MLGQHAETRIRFSTLKTISGEDAALMAADFL
jgi:hypothetical protein